MTAFVDETAVAVNIILDEPVVDGSVLLSFDDRDVMNRVVQPLCARIGFLPLAIEAVVFGCDLHASEVMFAVDLSNAFEEFRVIKILRVL